jgi:hypothetical protein
MAEKVITLLDRLWRSRVKGNDSSFGCFGTAGTEKAVAMGF